MSFFTDLERNVFRPIGHAAKQAGNAYGDYLRNYAYPTVMPIAGGMLGGSVGAGLGQAAGQAIKRGKFDVKDDLLNAATGMATAGMMSKLGGGSLMGNGRFLGGGPDMTGINAIGKSADGALSHMAMPDAPFQPGSMAGIGAAAPAMPAAATQGVSAGVQGMGALGQNAVGGESFWNGRNISALGNVATGALGALQQNQQTNLQKQQYNDQKAVSDEQRQRQAAMDPVRAQLLAALFKRLGVSQ